MSRILAIDTSAKAVSCAVMQDDRVLGSYFSDTGLTHSQTLLPMVQSLLSTVGLSVEELDALAVNAGPGSFTGVRIGVSTVKGLAFTHNTPCISVSTLEAMAYPLAVSADTVICCAMDARCQQVYAALFEKDASGCLRRLTPDEALSLSDLGVRLSELGRPVVLVGDGCNVCYAAFSETLPVSLAPSAVRMQSAVGTAAVAIDKWAKGETVSGDELLPTYLRLPQAERELRQRLAERTE